MFNRFTTAAASICAMMLLHAPAGATALTPDGVEKATEACETVNEYGPVEVVTSVEDGLGDWLVWVKDRDGDLWMCNASGYGAVFTNVVMQGDLLGGDGSALLGYHPVSNGGSGGDPALIAETLCYGIGNYIEEMQVVVTVSDGMGDYLTWLKNADDGLWVCNASEDAELFDFEPVDLPINGVEPVELRLA